MKRIILFILCLMPLMLFGQSQNVRHIITPDGEVTFWRGQQQLFVRGYTGEPIYIADHYVAANGNDSNPGTFEQPWATWQKAFDEAVAGDTIYIRGGTYYQPTPSADNAVKVENRSGSAGNLICIFAYPGEVPILDCGNGTYSGNNNNYGIMMNNCDYWHLKGLTVRNVQHSTSLTPDLLMSVVSFSSNYVTFEKLTVYGSEGPGIVLNGADNCLIKNCDVYDLTDEYRQQDANGILLVYCAEGSYNEITGCRSWGHVYGDAFGTLENSGSFKIDSCWAWDVTGLTGDGSGFENGPSEANVTPGEVQTVTNCIAANVIIGYTCSNDFTTAVIQHLYNNVSYSNTIGFAYGNGSPDTTHIFRNNLSYLDGTVITSESENVIDHNSWQDGITVSAADFVSLAISQLSSARKANGDLPDITCFTLVTGSDLKNAGVDVGLPYMGAAPDIGCFEFIE